MQNKILKSFLALKQKKLQKSFIENCYVEKVVLF